MSAIENKTNNIKARLENKKLKALNEWNVIEGNLTLKNEIQRELPQLNKKKKHSPITKIRTIKYLKQRSRKASNDNKKTSSNVVHFGSRIMQSNNQSYTLRAA